MDIQRSTLRFGKCLRCIEGGRFTGTISWVELKVGDDDNTHQLDPKAHLTALIGRQ